MSNSPRSSRGTVLPTANQPPVTYAATSIVRCNEPDSPSRSASALATTSSSVAIVSASSAARRSNRTHAQSAGAGTLLAGNGDANGSPATRPMYTATIPESRESHDVRLRQPCRT